RFALRTTPPGGQGHGERPRGGGEASPLKGESVLGGPRRWIGTRSPPGRRQCERGAREQRFRPRLLSLRRAPGRTVHAPPHICRRLRDWQGEGPAADLAYRS